MVGLNHVSSTWLWYRTSQKKSTHSAKLARIAHNIKIRCLFVLSVLEKMKLLKRAAMHCGKCLGNNLWIFLASTWIENRKTKKDLRTLTQHQYFSQVNNLDNFNEQLACSVVYSDIVGLSYVALFCRKQPNLLILWLKNTVTPSKEIDVFT